MGRFWHLHNHGNFSRGDALPRAGDYPMQALEREQHAVGLSDHGTMNGLPYMYRAVHAGPDSKKLKDLVVPVLGLEGYVVKDAEQVKDEKARERAHILIAAADETGYEALVRLNRYAYENFYYKPIIDHKILKELSDAGLTKHLIATTGCPSSEFNVALRYHGKEAAIRELEIYKSFFPNLYVEVMEHDISAVDYMDDKFRQANPELDYTDLSDRERNELAIEIANEFDLPYIVTNDVHYFDEGDKHFHDGLLICSTRGNMTGYHGSGYWMKTEQEMRETFDYFSDAQWEKALDGLDDIHEKVRNCHLGIFSSPVGNKVWHIPEPPPLLKIEKERGVANPDRQLMELVKRGLKQRVTAKGAERKKYIDQAKHELDVFIKAGFSKYFCNVSHITRWVRHESPCSICRENGAGDIAEHKHNELQAKGKVDHPYFGILMGPGRGSVCGSLVAYLIEITDIDPLKYDLDFDRFLDVEKVKYEVPDIDLDFQDDRREEVIQLVRDTWGEENVLHICNFTNRTGALAVIHACWAMRVPKGDEEVLQRWLKQWDRDECIDKLFDPSVEKTKPVEKVLDNWLPQGFEEMVRKLSPTLHTVSTHAAGLVVTPPGLLVKWDHTNRSGDAGGKVVSGFRDSMCESLGLVKMDILGLRTLRVVQESRRMIWYNRGIDVLEVLRGEQMDVFDEPRAYQLLQDGLCDGVFQFDGPALKHLCKEIKPTKFQHLCDINALARPGVSQFVPAYKKAMEGNVPEYPHAAMSQIFERTYGILLYEEQALKLSELVAGFTPAQKPAVKKAIKKADLAVFAKIEQPLIDGFQKFGGLTLAEAEDLTGQIKVMCGYSFNASHCYAYSVVGYWTAYIKALYATEYLAALIASYEKTSKDVTIKKIKYVQEARKMGIKVLPPDINDSLGGMTPVPDDNGTGIIRFGLRDINGIAEKGYQEIAEGRIKYGGTFKTLEDFEEWYKNDCQKRLLNKNAISALKRIGALLSLGVEPEGEEPDNELELLGMYVNHDPIAADRTTLESVIKRPRNWSNLELQKRTKVYVGGMLTKVHKIHDKNGRPMAFCNITMDINTWEITIFAQRRSAGGKVMKKGFENWEDKLTEGRVLLISGEYDPDRDQIVAQNIVTPVEYAKRQASLAKAKKAKKKVAA